MFQSRTLPLLLPLLVFSGLMVANGPDGGAVPQHLRHSPRIFSRHQEANSLVQNLSRRALDRGFRFSFESIAIAVLEDGSIDQRLNWRNHDSTH